MRVRKIVKSGYFLCHFCPSVRMEQLGSNWTDFYEIDILEFLESVEKIQISLNPDKNLKECHPVVYIKTTMD